MSKSSESASNDHQQSVKSDSVFGAVTHVSEQLQAIEKFFARRFDELSMEITATSQQVDMAEEGIIKRFSEVLEVLAAISHSGDGTTPANAGVELDAVVDMTEDAANKILDAAGRIKNNAEQEQNWDDKEARQKIIEDIQTDADAIFMACSFQDITGQRIRKTLENLRLIEDRLGHALERLGIKIHAAHEGQFIPKDYAVDQGEIDNLFEESRSDKSGSE